MSFIAELQKEKKTKSNTISSVYYRDTVSNSIQKSAKEAGISFRLLDWRHKLFTSFGSVSVAEFQGILESDDLFLFREMQSKFRSFC